MIPHFQMLYDRGPLLGLLAMHGSRPPTRCTSAARRTAGWVMREMQSPGRLLLLARRRQRAREQVLRLGHADEVQRLLTAEEHAAFAPRYGLDQPPNFENRHWHLYVAKDEESPALETREAKLLAARGARPGQAATKILVSWNALAIRGMAHAGRVFGNGAWIGSSRRAPSSSAPRCGAMGASPRPTRTAGRTSTPTSTTMPS